MKIYLIKLFINVKSIFFIYIYINIMDRFDTNNLYGGNLYDSSNISSYDPGHIPKNSLKGGKTITIKDDNSESILMNSSIKKVMQKNRELHKKVVELQLENEKLTKEKDKYKKIVDKYKSRVNF